MMMPGYVPYDPMMTPEYPDPMLMMGAPASFCPPGYVQPQIPYDQASMTPMIQAPQRLTIPTIGEGGAF